MQAQVAKPNRAYSVYQQVSTQSLLYTIIVAFCIIQTDNRAGIRSVSFSNASLSLCDYRQVHTRLFGMTVPDWSALIEIFPKD